MLLALRAVGGRDAGALPRTELQFWFGVSGANAEVIQSLARSSTQRRPTIASCRSSRAPIPETLQAGIDAFEAGQPPHIIQVFDVGTGVMMNTEGAFVPVADVLEKAGGTFDKDQYLPGIVAYYSRPDGTMLSFPFNSSSPILFYNKDVYRRAGLDVDDPPKTWPEVWYAARRIVRSGAATCGYTSAWLTWIHLENFAAWNNLPYATQRERHGRRRHRAQDQRADLSSSISRSSPTSRRRACFATAAAPRRRSSSSSPANAACTPNSSGGLGDVVKSGIDYGTGPLPYEPERRGRAAEHHSRRRQPLGLRRPPRREYKGVAAFFEFLSQTDIQSRLHQMSGYLPVTMAAYDATKASGFYEDNPGREQPILQMIGKAADGKFTRHPRGQSAGASRDPERGVRGDARRTSRPRSRRSTTRFGAATRRSKRRSAK